MSNPPTATMYLRGLPRRLVREAKAEAARRGTTLTRLVREALERILADSRTGEPEAFEPIAQDWAWYQANRSRLLRRYAGQYVAIVNRRVVDHDRDFDALARRVFARVGDRPVCMPQVTGQERVVNVPSPRIAR